MPPVLRTIYIVTHPNGFFGRATHGWKSLDLSRLEAALAGLSAEVRVVSVDRLAEADPGADDLVLYSSSDEPSIRQYYKDTLYFLAGKTQLVPRYEFLLAHENKGFQELLKRSLGIRGLAFEYNLDIERSRMAPPFVLKTIDGAGSAGVRLVRNQGDLDGARRSLARVGVGRWLIRMARSFRLAAKDFAQYAYRHKGFRLTVNQQFVESLACDHKVLVFGERVFVLRRNVRKGDFRASGSGLFAFESDPAAMATLLDYASGMRQALGVPYVSFDIATHAGGHDLIEFQAVHFGPYTLLASDGWFEKREGAWAYIPGKSTIEDAIGHALMVGAGGRQGA